MVSNDASSSTSNNEQQNQEQQQQPEPGQEHEFDGGSARRSISVKLIRHAESQNNRVYRDARYIYRGGTPDYDAIGWQNYIDTHRQADPGLSTLGHKQAQLLADYLVPHLVHQAHHPVHILVSPMRRTCLTLQPTLAGLLEHSNDICQVTVHGFFFESEGCHANDVPEEGMNPAQIHDVLYPSQLQPQPPVVTDYIGFPANDDDNNDKTRGWWMHGTGPETRAESERRAAKFYVWLCEHLDQQLALPHHCTPGIFDAGVSIPGEEKENEHDKHAPKLRRRHTQLLVGHGDFMSLVLKRIVAGFGHAVESPGIPHRSAFVHCNTGMTELEYFGHGRWLVMAQNTTPHLTSTEYLSGGSLKDGWSFLMPNDANLYRHAEVAVAFSDEELDDHVLEQREALKALYLSSEECSELLLAPTSSTTTPTSVEGDENQSNSVGVDAGSGWSVDQEESARDRKDRVKHFVVQHGHQVVATATYSERTGQLYDVAVRPSAGWPATEALLHAVQQHSKRIGRSGSLLVRPRSRQSRQMFKDAGFREVDNDNDESEHLEWKH